MIKMNQAVEDIGKAWKRSTPHFKASMDRPELPWKTRAIIRTYSDDQGLEKLMAVKEAGVAIRAGRFDHGRPSFHSFPTNISYMRTLSRIYLYQKQ
jgi:hypothetical protein